MNAIVPHNVQDAQVYNPVFSLRPADCVIIESIPFSVTGQAPDGWILKNPEGLDQPFTHELIYFLHCQDKVRIERGKFSKESSYTQLVQGDCRLTDFPEKKQLRALYYADALNEFLRYQAASKKVLLEIGLKRKVNLGRNCLEILLPIIKKTIDDRWKNSRGGSENKALELVGPRHFKRLHDLYVAGGYDPLVLVSLASGPKARASRFHKDDVALWMTFARQYAHHKRPTMRACREDLQSEIHKLNAVRLEKKQRLHQMPTRKVFENLIKGLGKYHLTFTREGEEAANKLFHIVHDGLPALRPGERVEMDEHRIDLQTMLMYTSVWELLSDEERKAVERTRLWMTAAIDVATKCILSLRFSSRAPSAHSSLAALEMMVTEKTLLSSVVGAGDPYIYSLVPENIFTDMGSSFKDTKFRAAVAALRCNHAFSPAGIPAMRGSIESFFKTVGVKFLHWFEGRTFSNILEKGRYNSQGHAVLNVDELNRLLVRAIIDIYHNTPHSGLGGETPYNAWMRLTKKFAILKPLDSTERRHVFGTELVRHIGDKGYSFLGLHYNNSILQKIRYEHPSLPGTGAPEVRIRVNRFSLKTTSFWDGNEWQDVDTPDLPNDVSVWEWVGAAKQLSETHAENAKVKLSVVLDAVNHMREAGEAAAARAELAADVPGPKQYADVEAKYFRKAFLNDLIQKKPELAQLAIPHDPTRTGIDVLRHLAKNAEEANRPPEDDTPPPVEGSGFSSLNMFKPTADDDGIDFDY